MKKRALFCVVALVFAFAIFSGCKGGEFYNGGQPVKITLWTYYNGSAKEAFDDLVEKFNTGVGKENNILIDAYSQGDVTQLGDAVLAAAKEDIGASPMPHIFAAYADNAFVVDELGMVANIEDYFTKEELDLYREDFLADGRFGKEDKLKIIPVAKSTENMYINMTDFEKFAAVTGAKPEDLHTWDGILQTAEKYYNYTDGLTPEANDGKALFGIDSFANFMIIFSRQSGSELYNITKDEVELNLPEETARAIWDNIYIPYLKGYYAKIGRFSSDDAKTGDVIAYTGSTAGADYFPQKVETGKDVSYDIAPKVLPYPVINDQERIAIQQGAGMVIAKSDEMHEKASALFLKWLTKPEQNINFAVKTNYLPVQKEALTLDGLTKAMSEAGFESDVAKQGMQATFSMLDTYTLYGNKPFSASYSTRKILENNLIDFINADIESLNTQVKAGGNRDELIAQLSGEENFQKWYTTFTDALNKALKEG